MAFPTLGRRPISITRQPKDNSIRVSFDGGYEHRRRRFTREVFMFDVTYDLLNTTDIGLLKTHFDSVGCGVVFDWTDKEGVTHSVYYEEPPRWSFAVTGWYRLDPLKLSEI